MIIKAILIAGVAILPLGSGEHRDFDHFYSSREAKEKVLAAEPLSFRDQNYAFGPYIDSCVIVEYWRWRDRIWPEGLHVNLAPPSPKS